MSTEMSTLESRAKIMDLEAVMLTMPQVVIPIEHFFAPGLYLRQMSVPAGVTLTGKVHKTEHYCILAKGTVRIASERGPQEINAPAIIHAMPGAKRAIHALKDTVWINVHHNPTNEQDPEKVESIFVADTFEEALGHVEQKHLEGVK